PWQDIADHARRLSRLFAPLLPRLRRSLTSARVALPGIFLLALGVGLMLRATRSDGDILCRSATAELLVQPRPVTVAEYAQYLDEQEEDTPHWELYPENWAAQRQREQAPVAGITHAQAEAYARARGAVLPSAGCLQHFYAAAAAAEGAATVAEWSSTRLGELLPGLPQGDGPVAVSSAAPYPPLPGAERASFRIATPHP
ncbi:MAG: SUMF1/EgtB/PvdO family nonheme iron enzyme, partial [Akkermansia sp.]